METKKDIRNNVLKIRSAISEKEWEEKSHLIYEKVIAHPFFLNADAVYCYVDYNHEADTHAIIEKAWKLHKKTAVPKVNGDSMEFYYIKSFSELQEGHFHILEPAAAFPAADENVLVIMPGTAFDEKRNRIGYGKGYYDKYLQKHTNYRTMAIAFDFQIVEFIPADAYDICPEVIVTEEKLYV